MHYAQLELYLTKFARGELGLVLLLGRHGTGKSESVKHALTVPANTEIAAGMATGGALIVEGHMQPFGLYRQLWDHRNQPIVLDDLDRLYADPDCVRLLKPLCNTVREKRLHWLTNLTLNDGALPPTFTTASSVILIANEWKSLNPNVRALEDRAIILHFCPSNEEVHRKVGQWLDDPEVYDFVGRLLPMIPAVSMRHYCKGSQLRRAGFGDWRNSLLQMIIPDRRVACVVAMQHDPGIRSEQQRVARFVATTGASRATYFRIKARLAAAP
ncbi:MAG: hypothetical protein BWX88_03842 [Planctomycetes bacterium ADurb.Bin126]|nr:MAG: hypothetical protein BWX88_03842 [Planctomycetes bacterium ADurb.Bin126]